MTVKTVLHVSFVDNIGIKLLNLLIDDHIEKL